MRKISADHIFPASSEPLQNGTIIIDDAGTILNVEAGRQEGAEYYPGIICPGFINTHCHLELSHMLAQVPENMGMTGFIKEVIGTRSSFSEREIQESIIKAENEMVVNGIVAVGDISNNNSTFIQKSKGNLSYHTFIEVFSMDPAKAEEVFSNGKKLEAELSALSLLCSIVPHAPYTMSEKLLQLINEEALNNNSILTIHNQESEGESELFLSNSGVMFDTFKAMGIRTELMRKTGKNSLRTTLPFLKHAFKLLLVHNTYTSKEDLKWTLSNISDLKSSIYFCTCPNANIYIENRLPDYNIFIETNARMTIGTDSLASNRGLSIMDEIKTISKHYPHIPLQTLITWATKNGAEFLGLPQLGTIEKGKRPGLNLLKDVDGLKITENTNVVKLV